MIDMDSFTDIHSHILPGVDDGARNMKESVAMLRMAKEEKIQKIILTPHQKPERKCVSAQGMKERVEELQEMLEKLHIDIQLYAGSECLYSHDLAERLERRSICTMAESRYVLTEFMPDENWTYIRDGLYRLICHDYLPVIAHIERYIQVIQDMDRVYELIDMGCYVQINAGSVTGLYGYGMKRTVKKLLKGQAVHFVGTDAHREAGKRSVQLQKCAAYLVQKYGKEYAERLLWRNAENIFKNTEF